MPSKVSWVVENHVLLVSAWDGVTLEDLHQTDEELERRLGALPPSAQLHLMMDYTAATALPQVNHFQHSPWVKDGRVVWLIVIVDNSFGRFFASLLGRVTGRTFRLVNTRADAYDLLAEIDPSILNHLLE